MVLIYRTIVIYYFFYWTFFCHTCRLFFEDLNFFSFRMEVNSGLFLERRILLSLLDLKSDLTVKK